MSKTVTYSNKTVGFSANYGEYVPNEMTYILGSRCKDGVLLIGDRKITVGTDILYEDKIYMDAPPFVVGSSGVGALFEKFRTKMATYIEQQKTGPVEQFIQSVEKFTRELNEGYKEVLEQRWSFDVLVGMQTSGAAILQYILPQGLAEPVRRYKVIGHGEPYGSIFLKKLWNKDMTMEQVGELGYFIIKYVERFELDNSVGVGSEKPQVWFIPDDPKQQPIQAAADTLDKFEDNSKKKLDKFAVDLNTLWSG
jgi:20S proteasome alpha/beta subunit